MQAELVLHIITVVCEYAAREKVHYSWRRWGPYFCPDLAMPSVAGHVRSMYGYKLLAHGPGVVFAEGCGVGAAPELAAGQSWCGPHWASAVESPAWIGQAACPQSAEIGTPRETGRAPPTADQQRQAQLGSVVQWQSER